jgi:hypothetical protein
MTSEVDLPPTCRIAFKEWSGVCQALAEGRQSVVLRKGGIAEGPGGFVPEHSHFWLLPTHVHEGQQGLREPLPGNPAQTERSSAVDLEAMVATGPIGFVESLEALGAIRDLHVWSDETIEKRFVYRRPGLWVIGVRVFRLLEPVTIAVTAEQAGCRSWVPIDPPLETLGVEPVLTPPEHDRRMERLRSILHAGG